MVDVAESRLGQAAQGLGRHLQDLLPLELRQPHPVVAELASLYVDTIGAAGPRVMVSGEPELLREAHNAERIRALGIGSDATGMMTMSERVSRSSTSGRVMCGR